jgi:hypothetical protein
MRSSLPAGVSNELQNVTLQHASIDTFVRHYSVGIHVDAQAINCTGHAHSETAHAVCLLDESVD